MLQERGGVRVLFFPKGAVEALHEGLGFVL